MEARTLPNRAQRAPRGGQDAQKTPKKDRSNIKLHSVKFPRRILSEKVANMAPSWPPKSKQHRRKIDANIDRKSYASWDRFLEDFLWIFGGKMETCWHQNLTQIDTNFEERIFEKTLFFLWQKNDFEGSGGRSWEQKSIKNRSKNEIKMGRPLGVDF